MAYQFATTLYPDVRFQDGYIQCGTSGAIVTSPLPRGMKSLTRTGTGAYTLVLSGLHYGQLGVDITPYCPTLTQIALGKLVCSSSQGGKGVDTITFAFQTAGSAADIPTNGGFAIRIVIQRSSVV